MNDALQQTLLIAICAMFVTITGTVIAFFTVRWIKSLDATLKELGRNVSRFEGSVIALKGELQLIRRDIEDHSDDLVELKSRSCSTPGCPFYDPDKTPTSRHARTRTTDVGEAYGPV